MEDNNQILFICLGPRCRKNNSESFIKPLEKILNTKIDSDICEEKIKLKSSLCMGQCKDGPNIKVNEKIYNRVNKDVLKKVLSIMKSKILAK
ncbi:MAG: hypothetical protein KatS3mg068_2163 [Candidatus Sericytochromatia bacterium]|nr:MAG: hypothetical protein KatS3mg068_2163 [Candidatus Sericytochromatia bacterium]